MKYISQLLVEKINKILLPQTSSYVHISIHIHNTEKTLQISTQGILFSIIFSGMFSFLVMMM